MNNSIIIYLQVQLQFEWKYININRNIDNISNIILLRIWLKIQIFIPVIKEEAIESRAEVKAFDTSKLKHVETAEKNPLPTPAVLKEELRPETLPDVSGVSTFDSSKLKHVETEEKSVLPTADGKIFLYFHPICILAHHFCLDS